MLSWRVRCCLVKFLPLLARISDKSKDSQSEKAGVGRGKSPGLSVGNLRALVDPGLDDAPADGVADEARRVVDVQLSRICDTRPAVPLHRWHGTARVSPSCKNSPPGTW